MARTWAWADLRRPFELTQEPPCRFALLRGPGRDYLYSCVHHIALDGFGTTLLFQRIAELYAQGLAGAMNSHPLRLVGGGAGGRGEPRAKAARTPPPAPSGRSSCKAGLR